MKFGIRIFVNLAVALAGIVITTAHCRGAAISVDIINGTAAAPDAGANWTPISGTYATSQIVIPIVTTNPPVFFRLKYP